jgi:uncharacterized protein YecE (DUF72 family)
MSAAIYIGTSGWSYPSGEGTWNGHFYPAGTRNELGYYSQFFNAVEVNSSFYAPMNPAYVWGWVRKTPPDFKFTAKLWQKFTHPRMYAEATGEVAAISNDDVTLFRKGIEPLASSGKLGALLVQFPPSFMNMEMNRRTVQAVVKTFREYPLAFELRHKSWSDDPSTKTMFLDSGSAWVQTDEPRFATSIARELPVTSGTAYFRFHGRNYQDWWSGSNELRYKYLYSEEEIGELAKRVKDAADKTTTLYAFFNNHYQGYAPKNARQLKMALESA